MGVCLNIWHRHDGMDILAWRMHRTAQTGSTGLSNRTAVCEVGDPRLSHIPKGITTE